LPVSIGCEAVPGVLGLGAWADRDSHICHVLAGVPQENATGLEGPGPPSGVLEM
jgi:hypothetical protein